MAMYIIGGILIYFPSAFWLACRIGRFIKSQGEAEAPTGRSQFQFHYPSASGLKLSVRVSSNQSVSRDAG